MFKPKISVIIPIYNTEKYLKQCMDSLLNQTFQDIEIIAVNDESTDNSLSILEKYAKDDNRIIIVNQKNGGAGKARNTGLDLAKGEYISFLDSDDFFEPAMLEKAYNSAIKYNSDITAFLCDFYKEEDNTFSYHKWTLRLEHIPPYLPFSYRQLTYNVFQVFVGWTWDKLFKREFIFNYNLRFQEQRTTNDLLFVFSAIVLAKKISVVPEILIHQRRDTEGSISKTREKSWDNFYYALLALRDVLKSNEIYNELEYDYINYAFHFILWNYKTLDESTQKLLSKALREEWFSNLGINDQPESYFLNSNSKEDYLLYINILEGSSL